MREAEKEGGAERGGDLPRSRVGGKGARANMQVSCVSEILIHPCGVQGSPLLRTVLLLLVLAGTGWWIARVTRAGPAPAPLPAAAVGTADAAALRIPYRLTVSAPVAAIEVATLDGGGAGTTLEGVITSTATDPVIAIRVRWSEAPAASVRRFAKMVLEIPGRDTLEHVFDAEGDIDDVWELPAPAPRL